MSAYVFMLEGLNGVNRQPSNGLKFNCQSTKKVIFYRQTSQVNINRQKVLKYLNFHYFSWSSRIPSLLKNLLIGKLSFHVLRNTLFRHYKTLQPAYIWKYLEFLEAKGHTKVNINYTEIDIKLIPWTKLLVNNRQPSKALKCNRQPSKLPLHHPIEALMLVHCAVAGDSHSSYLIRRITCHYVLSKT